MATSENKSDSQLDKERQFDLGLLVPQFLQSDEITSLDYKSQQCYQGDLTAWQNHLAQVDRPNTSANFVDNVTDYLTLQQSDYAPATIARRHAIFRKLARWMADGTRGYLNLAQLEQIEQLPRPDSSEFGHRFIPIDKKTIKVLRQKAAVKGRQAVAIELLLNGATSSEIVGIQMRDIEQNDDQLKINLRKSRKMKPRQLSVRGYSRRIISQYLKTQPSDPWLPLIHHENPNGRSKWLTRGGLWLSLSEMLHSVGIQSPETLRISARAYFAANPKKRDFI